MFSSVDVLLRTSQRLCSCCRRREAWRERPQPTGSSHAAHVCDREHLHLSFVFRGREEGAENTRHEHRGAQSTING